jgi:hypothetical protein
MLARWRDYRENAKFLWKRLPDQFKLDGELAAEWHVGKQLYTRVSGALRALSLLWLVTQRAMLLFVAVGLCEDIRVDLKLPMEQRCNPAPVATANRSALVVGLFAAVVGSPHRSALCSQQASGSARSS